MTKIYQGLLALSLLSVVLSPATARADARPAQDETRVYIRQLEKRISDLEAVIGTLVSGQGKIAAAPPPPVAEVAADEWGEPAVVADSAKGRDDEARRRLIELETWKRKTDARAAKEAEEAADKVKFDFSGKYKLRANSKNNLHLNNPAQFWSFDNSSYFDQRFQLKIDAEYGALSSVLVLDKGNFVFDWKEGSEGTLDRWSEFQTVTSALVRELYVQYTGNFVVKAGRHSMAVGNGGVVFEGPADALKLVYPIERTPLGRATLNAAYIAVNGGWRHYDNFTYPAGDRSAVLGLANKLDGWLLSLDISPRNNLTVEPYLLKVFDRGAAGDPDLNLDKDFNAATLSRDGGFEPLWTGLALNGKAGNYSFTGDLVYLSGSATETRDYNAYAVLLRGDYHLPTAGAGFFKDLAMGLEFGRGSGDSVEEKALGTGDFHNFSGLFLCRERRKFGNIFSQDLHAGYFFADSSLANVTFARAIVGFTPFNGARGEFALARLWTTESVLHGRGPVGDWSRGTASFTDLTRDIGWELDFNLSFPIMKRLHGFLESGYFLPGDAYRLADGQKPDPASKVVLGAEFVF